jgi:hypothetical protein
MMSLRLFEVVDSLLTTVFEYLLLVLRFVVVCGCGDRWFQGMKMNQKMSSITTIPTSCQFTLTFFDDITRIRGAGQNKR